MKRREFFKTAAVIAGTAWLGRTEGQEPVSQSATTREFYLLRRYCLHRVQAAGCDHYLGQAMLPALHLLGFTGVGCFGLDYGEQSPVTYLLLRHTEAMPLIDVDRRLSQDTQFVKDAESFRGAAGAHPAFERIDNTLLRAFEGKPILQVPARQTHSADAHLREPV